MSQSPRDSYETHANQERSTIVNFHITAQFQSCFHVAAELLREYHHAAQYEDSTERVIGFKIKNILRIS